MRAILRSLLLVEERLVEAEYFVLRMRGADPTTFGYELNAFLSAARSVTFLLQKEMHGVPGFAEWWRAKQAILRRDPVAVFFLELRNFSQKEGRVQVASARKEHGGWTFRFLAGSAALPADVVAIDAAGCCEEHLAKLASCLLEFSEAFPFHASPRRALTPAGLRALRLKVSDVLRVLGLPEIETWGESEADLLRLLRRHVDDPDFSAIKRLASPNRQIAREVDPFALSLVNSLQQSSASGRTSVLPVLAAAILRKERK